MLYTYSERGHSGLQEYVLFEKYRFSDGGSPLNMLHCKFFRNSRNAKINFEYGQGIFKFYNSLVDFRVFMKCLIFANA